MDVDLTELYETLEEAPEPSSPEEAIEALVSVRKAAAKGLRFAYEEMETLRTKMQGMAEKSFQDDNRVPDAKEAELRAYTHVDEAQVKGNRDHYMTNDEGVVRLRGHYTEKKNWIPGLLDDEPRTPWQSQLQNLVEQRNVVRLALASAKGKPIHKIDTPKCDEALRMHLENAPDQVRIFTGGDAALGGDWIPENWLPQFARELEMTPRLASAFQALPFPPGKTLHLPYRTGHLRPWKHAVPTADDPSNDPLSSIGTDEKGISIIDQVVATQIHRDSEEDALVAVRQQLMADLRWSLIAGETDAIVNGHTAGTQDALANWNTRGLWGTATSANDHRRYWDGLRRKAIAKSTAIDMQGITAALQDTEGEVLALLQQIDVAAREGDAIIVISPEYLPKMLLYPNLITWDKVGANASILTGRLGAPGAALPGQVGLLFGIYPVVVEWFMTADLNASGVYDNVTTNLTGMMAVSRSRYWRWKRKDAMVESDVNIRNNTTTLVARKRDTFAEVVPDALSAAEANVAFGYNLDPTL